MSSNSQRMNPGNDRKSAWLPPRAGYRPDIDGLRALAVLAVVIYHAFPKGLPGGFVGVDVFFVISGFLISTILFREMEQGTYSYVKFMARRMRRIFPALTAVLLSAWVGGWLLFTEQEFTALGKQIVSGSLFYANILFWSQHGYFDLASEFKPLLHLWSLGIEEQYYIFYPLLLVLIFRRSRRQFLTIMLLVFIASLFWGVRATKSHPAAAFFLLPSRFWELLLGGLIAYAVSRPKARKAWDALMIKGPKWAGALRNGSAVAGFTLMMAAFAFTQKENFPGIMALLPTVGAGLFIVAGPQAFINRAIFSFRPVVALGLISYPLYLWHWPLISFEYILTGGRPADPHLYAALVLSMLLAIATYHFIEKPLRHLSIGTTYRYIFPLAILTSLLGLAIVWGKGFSQRSAVTDFAVNEGETDHEVFHEYGNQRYHTCEAPALRDNALSWNKTLRCHQSKPGTDYDIILLGDSHAEQLFYGLAEQLPDKNIVYAINFGLPLAGNGGLAKVYDYLLQDQSMKGKDILLSGAWALHPDDPEIKRGMKESIVRFQKAGFRVLLTDDVPVFSFDPNLCRAERRLKLREQRCREKSNDMEVTRVRIRKTVNELGEETGASVLHTHDFFLEGDESIMAKDRHLLYRDFNHLNINGSRYLAERLASSGQLRIFQSRKSARHL